MSEMAGRHKHIATRWIMGGFTGKRVGTHFIYTIEEARKERHLPGFRWRNEKCRLDFLAFAKTGAQP